MKAIDRTIIGTLAVGVWLLLVVLSTNRVSYALSIDASDIDGLRSYVTNVVEDCSVEGEVYVYDVSGSEGYGNITSGNLSC